MSDGAGGDGGAGAAAGAADPLTGAAAGAAGAGEGGAGDGAGAGADTGSLPEWAASLSDDAPDDKTLSDRAWVKNKGYATIADQVKAQRELERSLGNDKLAMPKGPDDKAGWDRVFKTLGRPDSPEKYELPVPEGGDKEFAGRFAGKAFELGLTGTQAKAATEWWNGEMASMAAAQATQQAAREVSEVKSLRGELGGQYDATLETARRAMERFGFAETEVAAIRAAIGPKALITRLAAIGKGMGEDGLDGGGKRDTGMTPEKAEARRQEIMRTPELSKQLAEKNPAMMAEWKEIIEVQARDMERKQAA